MVKSCAACQLHKGELAYKPLKPINKMTQPFSAWAIDYIVNLQEMEEGYSYLLLMVDTFTKWVELIPMRSKLSSEVAAMLWHSNGDLL